MAVHLEQQEAQQSELAERPVQSLSIYQRRWRKFRSLKRGYYSLLFLTGAYVLSFFLPLLVNNKALAVRYEGRWYFPAVESWLNSLPLIGGLFSSGFYSGESLGQRGNPGECNYRLLKRQYEREGGRNLVILPPYPYGPIEDVTVEGNVAFLAPLERDPTGFVRLLGTDDRGRDVFARMAYGFQISLSFALLLALLEYLIGVPIGAALGFFGGRFDILAQRLIEIWATVPFLFLVIIVASIVRPNFILLLLLLALFTWIGITVLIRAEFYREKAKDYVAAAIAIGIPRWKVMFKHILPNSLVPIITYFPFSVVAGIGALVSLDFLGFGLPPPTPSWGEMMSVGLQHLATGKWWLMLSPMTALFLTLTLIVFIGESVREAFDPRTFSRLR
ncbi:MAG: ABC transporter permease subunit [Chlorobiota bacterium]